MRGRDEVMEFIHDSLKIMDIDFLYVSLIGGSPLVGFDIVDIVNDVTFDNLSQISVVFGTKNINVGCVCGTSFDPCHSRYIAVREITKIGAVEPSTKETP